MQQWENNNNNRILHVPRYTNDQLNISSCCEHLGTSIGKAGRRVQGQLGAARRVQERRGAARSGQSGQEQRGAARTCQERPGARVVVSIGVPALEERPGESRSDERPGERPGAARSESGQERPEAARSGHSGQERPRAARSRQNQLNSMKINENQ